MRLLRAFVLLVSFFLDVHVKADVLQAFSSKKTMQLESLRLVLDQGALVERGESIRLVRGQLYVESEKQFTLTTPFAQATCDGHCLAIFKRQVDHVWIQNLGGSWTFKRAGDEQLYALPVAMQFRIGEVAPDGRAQMDFPQSLPWKSLLQSWGHLFPGDKEEFKELLSVFRPVWQEAVEKASLMQQQGAMRVIASHEQDLARQASARRAQEKENFNLRRLFRQKNYLEESEP